MLTRCCDVGQTTHSFNCKRTFCRGQCVIHDSEVEGNAWLQASTSLRAARDRVRSLTV